MDVFSSRDPQDFCKIFADAIIKQTSTRVEEWIEVAKKFLSHLSPRINISPDPLSEISLSFGIAPSAIDIDSILDLPEKIAKAKNCRVVVCIDEFQQIGEYNQSIYFQRKLRTHWQHQQSASYCLFGSKKHMMNELFEKSNNPFYKFGELINLKKISQADWTSFIIKQFEASGKAIPETIATQICQLTDNYSSYVQQLAWLVWIRYDKDNLQSILNQSYEELLDHSSVLFEQQTQDLTSYQMNFLRAIIEGVGKDFSSKEIMQRYDLGTSGNVSRLKDALIKKELIDLSDGRYHIADPVLKEWLRRRLSM